MAAPASSVRVQLAVAVCFVLAWLAAASAAEAQRGCGLSATNVNFKWSMIRSTTAWFVMKATTFISPPPLGQTRGAAS